MKSFSPLASLALVLAAGLARGQASVQVSVSAGSVAVQGPSGDWAGLEGSAARATIGFSVGDTNRPEQFKFSTDDSGVHGTTFGSGGEVPGGAAQTSGGSTVTNGAIDYYRANWTSTLFSNSQQAFATGTGTFDPFDVTYGDVIAQTGPSGGTASLYFQSALGSALVSRPPGSILDAAYTYALYVTDAFDNRTNVLSLSFSTAGGLRIDFNPNSGVQLYLLGSNADDTSLTPGELTARGALIRSQGDANGLAGYFGSNGSPTQKLSFGLIRTVDVAPGGAAGDRLFAWHADTLLTTTPSATPSVPGPAAPLPFALFALRRRRSKA